MPRNELASEALNTRCERCAKTLYQCSDCVLIDKSKAAKARDNEKATVAASQPAAPVGKAVAVEQPAWRAPPLPSTGGSQGASASSKSGSNAASTTAATSSSQGKAGGGSQQAATSRGKGKAGGGSQCDDLRLKADSFLTRDCDSVPSVTHVTRTGIFFHFFPLLYSLAQSVAGV